MTPDEELFGYSVTFTNLWPDEPVFHDLIRSRARLLPDVDGSELVTTCGQVVATWRPTYREHMTTVPTRHAVRIGRPCRRCWPNPGGAHV